MEREDEVERGLALKPNNTKICLSRSRHWDTLIASLTSRYFWVNWVPMPAPVSCVHGKRLSSIETPKSSSWGNLTRKQTPNSFVNDKHMFMRFCFFSLPEWMLFWTGFECLSIAKLYQWCGTPWSKLSGQHRDGLRPAGECVFKKDQIQENPTGALWGVKKNTDFMWKTNHEKASWVFTERTC